jgi:Spy/CpxP family protein refolding chaperone
MKGKVNFKLGLLCAILSAMLVAPALGQGKDGPEEQFKQRRMEMIKQLKLAPDKEKALLAVEEKYESQRQAMAASMMKTKDDLQAAVASANPDEAQSKELVASLTSGMDALFNSFKSQREEELALMTPVDQGKYLLDMMNLRDEMMGKVKKEEPGKKK